MQGAFNVCNYSRKVSEVIPHDRVDLDLLVAGISLPIFMPPVHKGTDLYLDSVWIRDANLMEGVRRGAEELWVVWCIGNIAVYKPGAFNQYVHMIQIAPTDHSSRSSSASTRSTTGFAKVKPSWAIPP